MRSCQLQIFFFIFLFFQMILLNTNNIFLFLFLHMVLLNTNNFLIFLLFHMILSNKFNFSFIFFCTWYYRIKMFFFPFSFLHRVLSNTNNVFHFSFFFFLQMILSFLAHGPIITNNFFLITFLHINL